MQYQTIRCKAALLAAAVGGVWLMASMAWATFKGTTEAAGESAGTAAGLAALTVSLVLYLAEKLSRPQWTARTWWAMTALHAGLLVMIAGFIANAFLGEKGFVYIREGDGASFYVDRQDGEHALSFLVRLTAFKAAVYPGTLRPQGFTSDVVFEGDGKTQPARISVNESASFDGYRFYQQSYGVEVSDISRLVLTVIRSDGTETKEVLRPGTTVNVEGCGRVQLTDFVPTAEMKDGHLMVRSEDAMMAPAYRFQSDFAGVTGTSWVLAKDATTEQIGACRVHPDDFQGVRYTVLSVVRSPFDPLILLGALLAVSGAVLGFLRGRK